MRIRDEIVRTHEKNLTRVRPTKWKNRCGFVSNWIPHYLFLLIHNAIIDFVEKVPIYGCTTLYIYLALHDKLYSLNIVNKYRKKTTLQKEIGFGSNLFEVFSVSKTLIRDWQKQQDLDPVQANDTQIYIRTRPKQPDPVQQTPGSAVLDQTIPPGSAVLE